MCRAIDVEDFPAAITQIRDWINTHAYVHFPIEVSISLCLALSMSLLSRLVVADHDAVDHNVEDIVVDVIVIVVVDVDTLVIILTIIIIIF